MLEIVFLPKVKRAFKTVRNDISAVRAALEHFKENVNGWIQHLNTGQKDIDMRVKMLEVRIEQLEKLLYSKE